VLLAAGSEAALWTLILYAVLTVVAPPIFYVVSLLLAPAPRKKLRVKLMPFESGQAPIPTRAAPFPIEYFPYIIIYVAYAVIAVIAFIVVLDMISASQNILRGLIILIVLTFASIYASSLLPSLKQRLERGRTE
jgi:NADH:ubiquinone oxidoreductase subunit 3 (subunit A)